MDLGIAGRVALVVGGSQGVGREVASQLAAEGARVAIVARTRSTVDEAVRAILDKGGAAMGIAADMSDEPTVRRTVAQIAETWQAPHIAVGQIKYNEPGDFDDIVEYERYVDAFRAYTMSQIYLLHALLPGMADAGWGRFVHIGSATAKEPVGSIHHAVANATRPSTAGLLKTVADEYAGRGVTVNTVACGWIETEGAIAYMNAQIGVASKQERRDWIINNGGVPAGRLGQPSEIASLITYLCSDQAGYINGAWIEVDGGHHRSAM